MGLIHLWSDSFITDMAQKSHTLHTHKTDLWMSHITDMTHLFVSMSHYAYMNEATRRIHICDMTHAFTYVTWRTHSHMWHDARIHICFKTDSYKWWHHPMTHSSVWCDWFITDMAHSCLSHSWVCHVCDESVTSHRWTSHGVMFICVMWLIHHRHGTDITHVAHTQDSFICVPCLITRVWMRRRGEFTYVTWRSYICDMAHSHTWHDAVTYVTWHIHICDMTQLHMWHDAFTYVTWRSYICDTTHSHMWHDVFV